MVSVDVTPHPGPLLGRGGEGEGLLGVGRPGWGLAHGHEAAGETPAADSRDGCHYPEEERAADDATAGWRLGITWPIVSQEGGRKFAFRAGESWRSVGDHD